MSQRFEKLTIENFQSHVFTEMEFHPGLNVLVGPTDSGKSAILRALSWVLFNIPRGKDFIRHGARQCQVTLQLTDGTEIVRVRNQQSINRYILRRSTVEEMVFEGFGSEVPQEILDAHQIQPVKLEGKDVWIQVGSQLENAFLLSETAGYKAKMVGMVSGAHRMDQALKEVNRERKQLQSQLKGLDQQRVSLQEKLQPFENLPRLQKQLCRVEMLMEQVKMKQQQVASYRQFSRQWDQCQQERGQVSSLLESLPTIPAMEQKQLELERRYWVLQRLHRLRHRQDKVKKEQEYTRRQWQATRYLPELEAKLSTLQMYQEQYEALLRSRNQFQHVNQELEATRHRLHVSAKLDLVPARMQQLQQMMESWQRLQKSHQQWQGLQEQRHRVERRLQQSQFIPQLEAVQFPLLLERMQQYQQLMELGKRYQDVKNRLQIGNRFWREKEERLHQLSLRYAERLKKHGKCPTCGSAIHQEQLDELIQEIRGGTPYVAAGGENQGD